MQGNLGVNVLDMEAFVSAYKRLSRLVIARAFGLKPEQVGITVDGNIIEPNPMEERRQRLRDAQDEAQRRMLLAKYGYDPDLPARGVAGAPDEDAERQYGVRNHVCWLENVVIDGHSDPERSGLCIYCGAAIVDLPLPADMLDEVEDVPPGFGAIVPPMPVYPEPRIPTQHGGFIIPDKFGSGSDLKPVAFQIQGPDNPKPAVITPDNPDCVFTPRPWPDAGPVDELDDWSGPPWPSDPYSQAASRLLPKLHEYREKRILNPAPSPFPPVAARTIPTPLRMRRRPWYEQARRLAESLRLAPQHMTEEEAINLDPRVPHVVTQVSIALETMAELMEKEEREGKQDGPNRILTDDEYWLGVARAVAAKSECTRSQVGAIVVANGDIVGNGCNNAPFGMGSCNNGDCPRGRNGYDELPPGGDYNDCISVHAELAAMLMAGPACMGATLYTTREPCYQCEKVITLTGIGEVIWPGKNGQ